jgi:hypothetical protein
MLQRTLVRSFPKKFDHLLTAVIDPLSSLRQTTMTSPALEFSQTSLKHISFVNNFLSKNIMSIYNILVNFWYFSFLDLHLIM